jgi:hypothetical protein
MNELLKEALVEYGCKPDHKKVVPLLAEGKNEDCPKK